MQVGWGLDVGYWILEVGGPSSKQFGAKEVSRVGARGTIWSRQPAKKRGKKGTIMHIQARACACVCVCDRHRILEAKYSPVPRFLGKQQTSLQWK